MRKPPSSLVLVLTALIGAAATGFLVVLITAGPKSGESRSEQAGRGRGAGDVVRKREGPGNPGQTPLVAADAEPATIRAPDLAHLSAERVPFDDPDLMRMRAVQSARVTELIDELMAADESHKRYQLHRELKALIRKLGRRVTPEVRDRLLAMLDSVEPRWKTLVGDALGELRGDEVVAKRLLDRLSEGVKDGYLRNAVLTALGKLEAPLVAPALMGMLGHGREDEAQIVQALRNIAGPKETAGLLDMLDGTLRPDTRREIEQVLRANRKLPGLYARVVEKLRDESPVVRRSMIRVLELSRDPAHAKVLRDMLERESDGLVRGDVIHALAKFGDLDSGKLLLRLSRGGSTLERRRAVRAMHEIRNPQTLELLAGEWDALDEGGRAAIMGAASELTRPSDKLLERARDGLRSPDRRTRTYAVRVLGRIPGRDENVDAIGEFLGRAKHPSEWQAAFDALRRINTKKAAERALDSLHVVPDKRRREDLRVQFERILDRR